MNPYDKCPTYETEHLHLRQVRLKDAADLLECYKNPTLGVQGSAANCYVGPGGYGSQTKREMRAFIRMWLKAYRNREFVRWSVLDRQSGRAVGTVEMFGFPDMFPDCGGGVLRVDLVASYETDVCLAELLQLAVDRFYTLFDAERIVTKGLPGDTVRLKAIIAAGFAPYDWPDPNRTDYYGRRRQHGV